MNVRKTTLSAIFFVCIFLMSCTKSAPPYVGMWQSVQIFRGSRFDSITIEEKDNHFFVTVNHWTEGDVVPPFDGQTFTADYDKEHDKLSFALAPNYIVNMVYMPSTKHLMISNKGEFEKKQ